MKLGEVPLRRVGDRLVFLGAEPVCRELLTLSGEFFFYNAGLLVGRDLPDGAIELGRNFP